MTDNVQPDAEQQQPPAKKLKVIEKRTPPTRRSRNQLSGVQVMFAAILAIGMVLGISLSSRVASSRPLRAFYNSVETEIAVLRVEQSNLIEERNFAESDAFVEQWARGDGKMVRPGEILVVPEPVGADQQVVTQDQSQSASLFADVETTPPEPEPWELWWSLFFDGPPPSF